MKKQVILLVMLFIHCSSWSQKDPRPKGSCTDSLVMKTPGKWLKMRDNNTAFDGVQQQEAYKRLDQIHRAINKLCPQPVGVDIRWKRSIGLSYFGTTKKYYLNRDNVLTFDYGKLLNIAAYGYSANFSPHFCAHTDRGTIFMPGEKAESSTGVWVTMNNVDQVLGDAAPDDTWTIDGLQVRMRTPVAKEKWKDFEVQYPEPGSRVRSILIHRKGILPYKPVSRKLYLDYCISYYIKMYDDMIIAIQKRPRRSQGEEEAEKRNMLARFEKQFGRDTKQMKTAWENYLANYQTDEQRRAEELEKVRRVKEGELKKFTDELENTTKEGLLDSPAIILVRYYSDLIFETDPEKGYMLVTENPDYIRKDLPAYVPQMIVFNWKWNEYLPNIGYEKMFDKDFQIDLLQAMIDN